MHLDEVYCDVGSISDFRDPKVVYNFAMKSFALLSFKLYSAQDLFATEAFGWYLQKIFHPFSFEKKPL